MYTIDDVTISVTDTKAQFSEKEEKKKGRGKKERGGRGVGDSPLSGVTFRLIRALFGALRKSKERGKGVGGCGVFFFFWTHKKNLDTYTAMKKQVTLNLKSAESSFLSLDLKQHGKVELESL